MRYNHGPQISATMTMPTSGRVLRHQRMASSQARADFQLLPTSIAANASMVMKEIPSTTGPLLSPARAMPIHMIAAMPTPSPSTLGEGWGEGLRERNASQDPLPRPLPEYWERE